MPAFSDYNLGQLNSVVRAMYGKVSDLQSPNIEPHELLSLMAKPEDIPFLARARRHLYGGEDLNRFGIADIPSELSAKGQIFFEVPGKDRNDPAFPEDLHIQPTAPDNLVAYITEWVKIDLDLRKQFGRAIAVLDTLNSICASPQVMRFVWPTIVPLLRQSDYLEGMGDKIAPLRVPRSPPYISPSLKIACKEAAATITMALIAPDTDPGPRRVVLELSDTSVQVQEGDFSFTTI